MMLIRALAVTKIVILIAALAVVPGCGKKGSPKPPSKELNTYPGQYPKAETED